MSILGGCILPREEFVNKSAKSETLVILWLAQRSRCEAGEDIEKKMGPGPPILGQSSTGFNKY